MIILVGEQKIVKISGNVFQTFIYKKSGTRRQNSFKNDHLKTCNKMWTF